MNRVKQGFRRFAVSAAAFAAVAVAAPPLLAAKVDTKVAPGQARYLIQYNAGNKAAVHEAIRQYGGRVVFDYSSLINGLAADLSPDGLKSLRASGLATTIEADSVRQLDAIKAPVDDGVPETAPDALPGGFPDGSMFSEFVPWDRDRVNADAVWSTGPNLGMADNGIAVPDSTGGGPTGAGVVVGVLDTGVDYDHPDLAANLINDCDSGVVRDFLVGDDCPADDTFNGHGTSVSSVIASVDNEIGVIGVAPGAKIRPYRVCDGTCPLSAIIGGLVQAAADGVDVINMSFGGGAGFNLEASAVQAANQAGIVLVGSAGNDSSQKSHFPAGYDTVIAVSATDINDNPASFTNFGGWVDVAGPGVANPTATCTGCVTQAFVRELSPTMQSFAANEMTNSPITVLMNQELVIADPTGTGASFNLACSPLAAGSLTGKVALIQRGACSFAIKVANAEMAGAAGTVIYNNVAGNFFGTLGAYVPSGPSVSISQADGATLVGEINLPGPTTADVGIERLNHIEYWLISGTSFSAPNTAGVAALILEANPNLSPAEVRQIIEATAEPIGRQLVFGKGIVRADSGVNAAQP
jgi:subtilisin family serine protease